MNSRNLNRAQLEAIKARLSEAEGYLAALMRRMKFNNWDQDDSMRLATEEASRSVRVLQHIIADLLIDLRFDDTGEIRRRRPT